MTLGYGTSRIDRSSSISASKRGRKPRDSRAGEVGQACLVERLEGRQLLSAMPPPWPAFVGPMPEWPDPYVNTVPPGAVPTSSLIASNHTAAGNASYSFRIIYRDDIGINGSTIDSQDVRVFGPNGFERTAQLVSVDLVGNGPVRVARYKIPAPGGSWDHTDNGRYRVMMRGNQVFDVNNVPARDGMIGEFLVKIPGGTTASTNPFVDPAVDVRDFGALPNDGIDDTNAIQAAIDSLPDAFGVPSGEVPTGGVVSIPSGVYNLSQPLRLHSGIILRGAGANTVLHNVSTDRKKGVIVLNSPFVHRHNIGVGVENLTIYSRWGKGITIDETMMGDVQDLFLSNLRISTQGTAIDLRSTPVYFSDFENVEVYNPGSTALHLGTSGGSGAVNRIRDFRVTGVARSGFRKETALVFINCNAYVEGMTFKTTGANVLPLHVENGITLNGLDMRIPASSIPGGYAVEFKNIGFAILDSINNIGTTRKLKLTDAHDVQITNATSDGSSNIISQLATMDTRSSLRIRNSADGRLVAPTPPPANTPHTRVPAPTNKILATSFGLIPNDGIDDTNALQAAINSLPLGNGVPGTGQPVGGIVVLPRGIINTSAPIKLPSGVWLQGQESGTVIVNHTLGTTQSAIEFTSPYTHRRVVGAAVLDIGIHSTRGGGIKADATVTGDVLDLHLRDIRLAVKGPAVDLRTVQVNHAIIDRIYVTNPGTTAIWVGKTDNSSVGNLVRAVRMVGTATADFVREKALFVFHGETRIEGGSIEETFTNVLPFYASGKLTLMSTWQEYPLQPDNIGWLLDNVQSGYVDNIIFANPYRQFKLINGSNVTVQHFNIDGYTAPLAPCISVDSTSTLTIDTVHGQWDAGLLDHPRVIVNGVYNRQSNSYVNTATAMNGNFVLDPNMLNVAIGPANWEIFFGDELGTIVGSWGVETTPEGKRLRLTVVSNPLNRPLHVRVLLNVPSAAVGKHGIVRWRAEGPSQLIPYTWAWTSEVQGRAMGSLTAVRTQQPLRANEQIWLNIPNAQPGTYYISKLGVVQSPF